MAYQLPMLTEDDFEVDYSRKRKFSDTSSGSTSPSNSSSNCSDQAKKPIPSAAPTSIDEYLVKKRTLPSAFCPKQRVPTKRFQPVNVNESKAPKIAYIAKPLQHTTKRPLAENTAMQQYRAYRQMEMEKAQAAKVNGGLEEPPKKKSAPRRRKERNY